jgi:hypothetical protein
MLETLQSLRRKGYVRLVVRDRKNGAQHDVIAARGETDDLPCAGQVLWKLIGRPVFYQHAE